MEPLPVPSAGLELRKPERVALHTVFQADREYRGASSALGETRDWLCGLVPPGAPPVCSGWHCWLALGHASRV